MPHKHEPGAVSRQAARHFAGPGAPPGGLPYLLHLPAAYDADAARRWPLILFLHGAGERGRDLSLVRQYGIPHAADMQPDFPFITVAPQCPPEERWQPPELAALLDAIERTHRVDADRIYVTGLSMGGFGTWALTLAQPHRFAAIAPVCGGGDPSQVCALWHLPVWAFHGARDEVVPLQRSQETVDALRVCGGDVRFTVYPDAGHDSWTPTYANSALYTWFLAHRRARQRSDAAG